MPPPKVFLPRQAAIQARAAAAAEEEEDEAGRRGCGRK